MVAKPSRPELSPEKELWCIKPIISKLEQNFYFDI
jgi:hypothetical protein